MMAYTGGGLVQGGPAFFHRSSRERREARKRAAVAQERAVQHLRARVARLSGAAARDSIEYAGSAVPSDRRPFPDVVDTRIGAGDVGFDGAVAQSRPVQAPVGLTVCRALPFGLLRFGPRLGPGLAIAAGAARALPACPPGILVEDLELSMAVKTSSLRAAAPALEPSLEPRRNRFLDPQTTYREIATSPFVRMT